MNFLQIATILYFLFPLYFISTITTFSIYDFLLRISYFSTHYFSIHNQVSGQDLSTIDFKMQIDSHFICSE